MTDVDGEGDDNKQMKRMLFFRVNIYMMHFSINTTQELQMLQSD